MKVLAFFQVLDADEQEVVAMMHSGKLFGQILLVFDLPRINSIRCKTNCDIFVLNKHDFRMVLSDYPEGGWIDFRYKLLLANYVSFSSCKAVL